jgi:hypothetical protein
MTIACVGALHQGWIRDGAATPIVRDVPRGAVLVYTAAFIRALANP